MPSQHPEETGYCHVVESYVTRNQAGGSHDPKVNPER